MTLRFHWMLPKSGEVALKTASEAANHRWQSTHRTSSASVIDLEGWVGFCQCAETAGIESLLISFSYYEPDPFVTACALGRSTNTLKFLAAYRSGLIQPQQFVQQLNTLSHLINGRVAINVVAGSSPQEQRGYGDFLDRVHRYERATELLEICSAYWQQKGPIHFDGQHYRVEGAQLYTTFRAPYRTAPEIYISGHSEEAQQLAFSRGSCWVRTAESPSALAAAVRRARDRGTDVCLRCLVICRPNLEEAYSAARALLPDYVGSQYATITTRNDSQMFREALDDDQVDVSNFASLQDDPHWLTPWLWTGLVPHNGPVWAALVGTPETLADAFLQYQRIGVSQFILSGCPELDEMVRFGKEVIPRVRQAESQLHLSVH